MKIRDKVLILGGGFGGLYTAIHLDKTIASDRDVEVILVNRENFFLFNPLLHEVAASDLDLTHIVNPIRKIIRHVKFIEGEIESIYINSRKVVVTHGIDKHHHHELYYDHLVIALGNVTNFKKIPGLQGKALTMKSLGDAIHLRNLLIEHLEEADFEKDRDRRESVL
ncbi:MAG: FAD-dependent oxidoreductase, partial [Candidatus Scalindua sp.]